MGSVLEDGFVDAFQDHPDHFLDPFVVPSGNAERSFLSSLFRDLDASDRLEARPSLAEPRNAALHPFFREPVKRNRISACGDCASVGVEVGRGFVPHDGIEPQTEHSIDAFFLV